MLIFHNKFIVCLCCNLQNLVLGWMGAINMSLLTVLCCLVSVSYVSSVSKPNILFILTDDQDVFLNGTVSIKNNLANIFYCHWKVPNGIINILHPPSVFVERLQWVLFCIIRSIINHFTIPPQQDNYLTSVKNFLSINVSLALAEINQPILDIKIVFSHLMTHTVYLKFSGTDEAASKSDRRAWCHFPKHGKYVWVDAFKQF